MKSTIYLYLLAIQVQLVGNRQIYDNLPTLATLQSHIVVKRKSHPTKLVYPSRNKFIEAIANMLLCHTHLEQNRTQNI